MNLDQMMAILIGGIYAVDFTATLDWVSGAIVLVCALFIVLS